MLKIKRLEVEDFNKGFFESLSNLDQSGLSLEEAQRIYQKISQNPV